MLIVDQFGVDSEVKVMTTSRGSNCDDNHLLVEQQ